MLAQVGERLRERHITLEATEAARTFGPGLRSAVRRTAAGRVIQRLIETPIVAGMLRGEFAEGDTIVIDVEDGELTLRVRVAEEVQAR